MLVDWLIYGLLVFGAAKLLNATAFKLKPASGLVTWTLTILMFIVSVVALSTLKVLRYQAISDSVGVPISPQNPLDMGGAVVFAWLFCSFLNRQEKTRQPPLAGGQQ
ncbi:MAG: hypothetical protein ACREQ8_14760 [Woeseiaceae bacterium]